MAKKVYMLVANPVLGDPRVRRESKTLAENGYQVSVGGIGLPDVRPQDRAIPGVDVLLPPASPFHRLVQRASRSLRKASSPPASSVRIGVNVRDSTRSNLLRTLHAALYFWGSVTSLVAHRSIVKSMKPDIIHAHDLNALLPAVLLARSVGARVIYDSHEVFSEMGSFAPIYRQNLRALEQKLLKRVDLVVTVSDGIADLFVEWYQTPKPCVLLNVPDVRPLDVDPHRHSGPISFVYQGGLVRDRGLELLVDAFLSLPRRSQARLIIRGFGELRPYLETAVKNQAMKDRVSILEPVPPHQVVGAAAEFDVGVIPFLPLNLNHILALPNKLFEYLAAGVGIWATDDLVEVKRILREYDCGKTYQPERPEQLADQLVGIFAEDITQLKTNALRAARQRFNWDEESQVLLGIYRDL